MRSSADHAVQQMYAVAITLHSMSGRSIIDDATLARCVALLDDAIVHLREQILDT